MREMLKRDIAFEIPKETLLQRLHAKDGSEVQKRALALSEQLNGISRPAYLVRQVQLQNVYREGFEIEGVRFCSKIAASKLADEPRVFVYIATAGEEISECIAQAQTPLDEYITDQIAYTAYMKANTEMLADFAADFEVDKHIRLGPGSVRDWSVEEIKKLFSLLDGADERLGVKVLPSGLMNPIKSTCGLLVQTQEEFESCAICPRQECEGRRCDFDLEMYEQMEML